MMASNESNKLLMLQKHVNDLNDQKTEVNRRKSELLQMKDFAISDVSGKCESLKKSINKSKTSAIRQLTEFYEEQEKLFSDSLENLESRINKAEKELIIDLNGMPVPGVKAMSYDFDVSKAKTSIDQLELKTSMGRGPIHSPSEATTCKASTSKESETIKATCSTGSQKITIRLPEMLERIGWNAAGAKMSKQQNSPTSKKPRLIDGQKREHVRDYITCCKCNKPRCIYRDHFLMDEEKLALSKLKASASYVCGRQLSTDKHKVAKTLLVEDEIDCECDVSWHYFQPKLRNPLVCYMCGSSCVSPMNEEEKKIYRSLHKICAKCQFVGGKPRSIKRPRVGDSDDELSDY